ncbi:hypothetical protein MOQ_002041 [Trypanosoma cruzi marinkellei]|uniref:Uncharacterized protein n=1 Tax=Trypanosoma cruzi marinkellei TaxID=85056 RepID=K2MR31_TRYCR|nr:hypothetical protein MOQ_002041 [Trypanosoma cruzi marinkellei]
MRRSVVVLWTFSNNTGHYSPPVYMPLEYASRVTNQKQLVFTHPKDPKYGWNTHVEELASLHPGILGPGRRTPQLNWYNRGGIVCEIPPVPVYRQHIWCQGHSHFILQHPKIFIKCPPGVVVCCKWCRLKFINMSTEDDNDDDWESEEHKISTTPETVSDLMQPRRDIGGVLRDRPFQDGKEPDPHVYRSVFDPERHRWKHPHHKYEVHPAYADSNKDGSGGAVH